MSNSRNTIPEEFDMQHPLISHATLVYVGFSRPEADELWATWSDWPLSGPRCEVDPDDGGLRMSFIDFITGPFDRNSDVWEDDDQQWHACLDAFGIAADVQRAIMDPRFKDLRLTRPCAFWAKDTVEMRYAGLEDIRRASRERERSLQRESSHPGGSSSSAGPSDQGTSRSAQREATPGIAAGGAVSTRAVAAREVPGHTVLFKGLDRARIHGLFDDSGSLSRIETLLSSAPSDFSGTRSLFCFSPDYKVAEYNAAYAKRRANCEDVVIVRVSVPDSAIEQLDQTEIQRLFWPDAEWKELIWRSRTNSLLPSHLRKYRLATLIIGTISRKPDGAYHRMRGWEEIDERCVLKVEGSGGQTNAVQYVFSGEEEGREFLAENCADGISVLPYDKQELDAWMVAAGN